MPKYYEDLEPGATRTCGSRTLTRDEIVEFAERFDPQPFHVDEAAAQRSIFGGIVASGLHTMCASMRLYTDDFLDDIALVAGRGLDEVRFPNAVYPGDTLSVRIEGLEKSPSPSDPSWGEADVSLTTVTRDGETVLSLSNVFVVERRPADDSE
ncbi:MaoC domain protein dehydratase (plasmid) [Haloterrigena turkmenica DSM 5511]|uniref:MaoC domain protein dehydratase n=1 Tax=Haloterrigena turkmenica (strain ATCC 51198 / DSM 5511 / JCM 9101 / NCIMB 13204 / VKM B-1734 / 4k) TaxID=543526 RepID=D2RZX7_HALTV|nr:MaoC family dehydratase [Haloterrigena turkmenica]ADB62674.1 MaoC domain protein dehydratase [Haloterrigena turkmenica DSM 5511]